jgi:hypothetical protein
MPPEFIRLPAMMKNGMARRGKESVPPTIRWSTTRWGWTPSAITYIREAPAREMATGTPMAMSRRKPPIRARVVIGAFPPALPG